MANKNSLLIQIGRAMHLARRNGVSAEECAGAYPAYLHTCGLVDPDEATETPDEATETPGEGPTAPARATPARAGARKKAQAG